MHEVADGVNAENPDEPTAEQDECGFQKHLASRAQPIRNAIVRPPLERGGEDVLNALQAEMRVKEPSARGPRQP